MYLFNTFFLASAMLSGNAQEVAQDENATEPQAPAAERSVRAPAQTPDCVPCIEGIVLLGSHFDVLCEGGWKPGYVSLYNLCVPGNDNELLCILEKRFLGQPLSSDLLFDVKEAILCHYRTYHRPFVTVEIPEQNVSNGVIQFVVQEACVGNICVTGNTWFDDQLFLNRLNISPGDAITTQALLTDVAWLNRNPFHRTEIRYSPGDLPGTTNIELVTADRLPFRPYVGVDNTGNRATGQARWFAGVTWGNAFGLDHLLSYQVTVSTDCTKFISNTLNYVAPLPWQHTLQFYGGYAKVSPHINHHFHCEGHSSQASLRYEIPIGDIYDSSYKEVRLGFDFKNTNNNLIFLSDNEVPIITNDANITQFVAGFDYGKDLCGNLVEASFEVFWSPGELVGSQTKEDYEKLRCHSTSKYVYATATASYNYPIWASCCLSFLVRAQYASENLLPSEQFGLGGYDTVRGYAEREVNVDNAGCFNLELRSKPFNLMNFNICGVDLCDELILLAFYDYGAGYNHYRCGIDHDYYHLMSIGPGLRYNLGNHVSARLDVGFKLQKTQFDDGHGARVHFGVMAIY